MGRAGIEPARLKATILQTAAHSSRRADPRTYSLLIKGKLGSADGIRTRNHMIESHVA